VDGAITSRRRQGAGHDHPHDPRPHEYVDRRRAEGRTTKEIRRCLKRYLARQIYRHLNDAGHG
jgi:hypothetical protein